MARNRQSSTESGEISWSFLRANPFFRNGSNPLLDQSRQISFPRMPFDPGTLEHIDFCWKGLGYEGNGHCCWSCSAPPAGGKHSAHRGQEERNLVGLTQHTPHARLPGTRPATQESEATVWTSEHRHESAGDRRRGFTADCASYQILAELGSHICQLPGQLYLSVLEPPRKPGNTGTILPPTLSSPAGWSEAQPSG